MLEFISLGSIKNGIEILEKFAELALLKKRKHYEYINDVIDPLFHEFEAVAKDYISIFQQTRNFLDESMGKNDFAATENRLRDMREKMIIERVKIRKSAKIIAEKCDDENVKNLCQKLYDFFYFDEFKTAASLSGPHGPFGGSAAAALPRLSALAKVLVSPMQNRIYFNALSDYTIETTRQLEERWTDIVGMYSEIKLKSRPEL